MEAKEILTRLEIVKLATTIGDNDTIVIQSSFLQNSDNKRIDEIISLLKGKNYRQALYLIKAFIADLDSDISVEKYEESDEEQVLDVEDMLRMSPLAKDTIKNYQKSSYTNDDLEAFAKNIEKPISDEYKNVKSVEEDIEDEDLSINNEVDIDNTPTKEIKTKIDNEEIDNTDINNNNNIPNEISNAVEKADSDTPLDEISSEQIDNSKKSRKNTLSKYKKLREKFSRKSRKKSDNTSKNENESKKEIESKNNSKSQIESNNDNIKGNENKEEVNNVDLEKTTSTEKDKDDNNNSKSIDDNTIYSPIPHIEQKFIQSFVLYSPKKESGIWVEDVVKFLKKVSKDSFTETDVKFFLNEFDFYLSKNEVSKASQILLLASATDSKYAQFLLARELFSGKILSRDLKKSFVIMKNLANQFYPEAVCDLGQFYEHGIGVTKDRKVAIKLYEKAFELGISRATKHINRLKESNSFLSTIFKLK